MGHPKLFAKDDHKLEGLLQAVKKFSDDIGMKFGLEKCRKETLKERRLEKSASVELDNSTKIKELEQEEEVCKYLHVNESNGIQHVTMKEKIRKESYKRVKANLKTSNPSN